MLGRRLGCGEERVLVDDSDTTGAGPRWVDEERFCNKKRVPHLVAAIRVYHPSLPSESPSYDTI